MKKVIFIFIVLLFISMITIVNAQNRGQDQETNVNKEKLLKLADEFHHKFLIKRAEVERVAKEKGWMIREETDQGVREIQYIDIYGMPQYYQTTNLNAARTTNTDDLWVGGSSGLNLSGDGYLIGEWDGGGVLTTHQEFDNGGGTRVTQMDSPGSTHYHSTHVAGTIIAEGQSPNAHGMAPEALLNAYEWTDAETEMSTAAANGLTLSNHSYGWSRGWVYNSSNGYWYWYGNISISTTEDYLFGFYDGSSEDWDQIANNAPHYLIVKSSGNDRNDDYSGNHLVWNGTSWVWSTASRDPDGGTDGYDCIGQQGVAKNILTVGAVNDITGGWTSPSDVVMTSFSSWGPTDDGRIKPDIVANGWNLYSCSNSGNSSYMTLPGTSMSAPNVTGTLAVLQDYYEDLRGGTMSAAAIKGLVINTANEAGPADGPDYMFGWGLLNATGAADLIIMDNTEGGLIVEGILENGQTIDYTYYCDGTTDINVTLCWTDPAATPLSPQLNPTTSMLVNELDLKIYDEAAATYYAWKLNPYSPSAAATHSAENWRDNVEVVNIQSPSAGYYTLRVDHDGSLSGGQQAYALIVTGLTTPPIETYCDARATNEWEYIQNVTMGDIDNTSDLAPGGYANYTGMVTEVSKGSNYTITATLGNAYTGDDVYAWVDWNHDGDFTDTGEDYILGISSAPYSTTISIPSTATLGYTTMRVRMVYSYSQNPCGTSSYGETEDYTLRVLGTPGLWIGTISDDWNNPLNWDDVAVPTSTVDVTIPAGTPYSPVISSGSAVCDNLDLDSGATLSINGMTLVVNGDMYISGEIGMLQDDANINIMGDVAWNSGSSLNVTAYSSYINVYGDWNFNSGANVNPTLGFVDFEGSSSSWIRCYSDNCSFNNLRVYKSGGAMAQVSNLCTEDLVINALTFISSDGIFNSRSDNDIIMRGYFNYYGTFDFTLSANTGSVIFDGNSQSMNKYSTNDGIFNNVVFSSSTGMTIANGGLTAMGNVTINQGFFNPGVDPVYVGGNWTNYIGASGFVEGTGRVIFNGSSGHQYCSSETFNELEVDKSSDALLMDGTNVVCAAYDWTAGAVDVLSGSFTANDLLDNAIQGGFYLNSGGTIDLTNSGTGTYVDLKGDLHIFGGTMTVAGSFCVWPYQEDASIEMSGGILDITSCGISLSSSNTLTESITGGTIRTAYGFTGTRTDFNPTGGTIELYGSTDAIMSMGAGSNFYNVNINKAATDRIEVDSKNKKRIIQDRDGSVIELTRSYTVNATSELDINGDLLIDAGTFNLNGNTVNVGDDVLNYGELTVDGILEISDDFYLYSGSIVDLSGTIHLGTLTGMHGSAIHYSGSTFNQTDGNYYVESIHLYNGSQFNGTGGTTHIYVDGHVVNNNVDIDDPDSYFYNFYVDSGANAALSGCSYDLEVNYSTNLYGLLDINSYTINTLYSNVYGELIIDSGGTVNVTGNGPYFSSGGSLTMISGSELNSEQNIRFYTGTTENVSGGEIFLAGSFSDYNEIFSPTGGSVTFDGSSASDIIGPTAFYDLNIDKTGATVTANSSFSVSNNLDITSGALTLNGYTVDVANDVDVYGTLNVTNPADILNVGNAAYDNLAFRSGSFGNLTAGVVNLSSWLWVDVGGLMTATTGNTINFSGPGITGIQVDAAGSVFGNINIISVNPFRLYSLSSQLIQVDGNFDLQAGNTMEFMNNSMIVHGNFTDDPTSTVYVYDGPVDGGNTNLFSANGNRENQNDISITKNPKNSKDSRSRGGNFEIDTDFTLNGLLDVGDGDVLVHGEFELATTGTLTINGGSFINDESARDRAWRFLQGTFNLSDGLFEITNNSTYFASTATTNISGGTIRTGGAFYGVYTGTFQPTGGIVEIIGGGADNAVYCSNGNYFYDLVINRNPGIFAALMQEIHVQNDLSINSGILSCNFTNDDLYVGGNWTNNVGSGGFVPSTNTVIFDGTGDVSITPGETFYNLTLDKVSSADHLDLFGPVTVGNDLTINPGALYSNDNTISVSGNVTVNSGGVLYMEANSTLEIGAAKSLNVYNGGTLEVLGAPGNLATITHLTSGNYYFNVYSGGTIGAEYGLFEYMTENGVFVWDGGIVDPTYPFNYSIFQNGFVGFATLLLIDNFDDVTITGANFPDASSSDFNVAKTIDQGTITLISATGDFAGPDYEYDLHDLIHWDGYNPDLDITNVIWTDTNPYVCDMITASVTVYNNGNVSISGGTGFYLDLYHNPGSPPAPFETGDQSEYITSGIPAGDFIVVDFDVVNDVVESWNSYIQVDTYEDITELEEGNNVWGPDAITWNPFPVIDDLTIQYNAGTNEVELNWTYPITVDQYKIYRSTDPYDFAGADIFTSSTESYSEIATGIKYFYQVTAERTCTASDNINTKKNQRFRRR